MWGVAGCRSALAPTRYPVPAHSYIELTCILSCFVADEDQIGYLAQHELFDQIPMLRRDIMIPDYCHLSSSSSSSSSMEDSSSPVEPVAINCWFGPAGRFTVSPELGIHVTNVLKRSYLDHEVPVGHHDPRLSSPELLLVVELDGGLERPDGVCGDRRVVGFGLCQVQYVYMLSLEFSISIIARLIPTGLT